MARLTVLRIKNRGNDKSLPGLAGAGIHEKECMPLAGSKKGLF
jgi:hypothetical protein